MMASSIHNFRKSLAISMALLLSAAPVLAGEGMWLPLLLKSLNEAEMKAMGMKMSAEDIYSVNQGSLKDAVVLFGGFCTGELISDEGLLLTNHHCGYDAIQSHSTLEKNNLKDGYWARNHQEELPNPGLYATFIVRMENVSDQAFAGLTDAMTPTERQAQIDKNLLAIRNSAQKETWQEAMTRSFFEGNQYYLFITETYRDVRYVGSPPESIGKFGADTDNWVWPRHTGDFSLFRIYAGPDNKPAEYSPDNKPLKPKHFFPVSMDGVQDGDFTLVFGFPGRTNQYLPSFAVQQTADIIDPARIEVRNISLGIMDKNMRASEEVRLAYAAKYASLANYWKKWIGEVQGLNSKHAVSVKEKQESEFAKALARDKKLNAKYGSLLPEMKDLYSQIDTIVKNRTILAEVISGSNVEIFLMAAYADRLIKAYQSNGEKGYSEAAQRLVPTLDGFYKEYRKAVDQQLFAALTSHLGTNLSPQYRPEVLKDMSTEMDFSQWTSEVFANTRLTDQMSFLDLIEQGGDSLTKSMAADKAYQVFVALKKVMDEQLSAPFNMINQQILPKQKEYVAALIAVYPDRRFWPDANSTLRVAYGQVEPYAPKDGMTYKTQTYLEGIMEKYIPGDYEFDVHPKLIELYEKKDYGPYGDHGKMPVCFIASNHTTGGNSGSPAIDAYGNLIGLNFDRVWEGTMSDLYYDKSICRNIMVDARYILFIIDKFAGAGHLVKEMKLVHPKA